MTIERIPLDPSLILNVTEHGSYSHEQNSKGVLEPSGRQGPIPKPVARGVLEGAYRLGLRNRLKTQNNKLNLCRYAYELCGAYVTTSATPGTMRRCAERLEGTARQYALQKAEEESDHDLMALEDLRSLGLPAEELVRALRPRRAVSLVESFTEMAEGPEPLACFGYAWTLERPCLDRTPEFLSRLQAIIPPGADGATCLRLHSCIGEDADHVSDVVDFFADRSLSERAVIARAAYRTALLCIDREDNERTEDDYRKSLKAAIGELPYWFGSTGGTQTPSWLMLS